ncbi:MAG: hypothetical protein JW816_02425 [Candidatus Buchananbacteria bacterium]|nr:hypothetical protein [Candidatus Buchananbacteria bacterium]
MHWFKKFYNNIYKKWSPTTKIFFFLSIVGVLSFLFAIWAYYNPIVKIFQEAKLEVRDYGIRYQDYDGKNIGEDKNKSIDLSSTAKTSFLIYLANTGNETLNFYDYLYSISTVNGEVIAQDNLSESLKNEELVLHGGQYFVIAPSKTITSKFLLNELEKKENFSLDITISGLYYSKNKPNKKINFSETFRCGNKLNNDKLPQFIPTCVLVNKK